MTHTKLFRVVALLLVIGAPALAAQRQQNPATREAVAGKVWLTPTCGCCGKWVEHMLDANFKMTREVTTELDSVAARKRVPEALRSCHTALVGQYIIEGHVPADLVRQLLKDKPNIVGIAVPGMVTGSPGMEGPNPRPYSVVAFKADGTTYEFARR